jgi:hypothetical protein
MRGRRYNNDCIWNGWDGDGSHTSRVDKSRWGHPPADDRSVDVSILAHLLTTSEGVVTSDDMCMCMCAL